MRQCAALAAKDHVAVGKERIAGDSSYTEDAMLRGAVDGVGADEDAERLTHERIRAYAAATPTVYLPSHDPETSARLAERRAVGAAPEEVGV